MYTPYQTDLLRKSRMPCYYSQPVTDVNAIHTNKRTHTHTLFPLSPFTFNTIPRFSSAQNDSHANNCFHSIPSFWIDQKWRHFLIYDCRFSGWTSGSECLAPSLSSPVPFLSSQASVKKKNQSTINKAIIFFPKVFFEFTSQALYRHDRNICDGTMLWVVLKQTNMVKGLIKFCIVST